MLTMRALFLAIGVAGAAAVAGIDGPFLPAQGLEDDLDFETFNGTATTAPTVPAFERPAWADAVSFILIVLAGFGVQYVSDKTVQVVIAVVTGTITGMICTGLSAADVEADAFSQVMFLPGSMWLKALKALVLPLIVFAMIDSMVMLRNLPGARSVGLTVVGMYTLTTVLAATEGCVFAYTILSGTVSGREEIGDPGAAPPPIQQRTVLQTILGLFVNLIPTNFVDDAAKNNLLPLICAALAFGGLVKTKKSEGSDEKSTVLQVVEDSNDVVIGLIQYIMMLTPYGVGSLVFQALVKNDITQASGELFYLSLSVICGLLFHALVVYPSMLKFVAGINPLEYISNIVPAILTALGSASSAATLPVSIQMAKERNGIQSHIADFVLSLGATINMDGTGLYLICATYFMARLQNFEFGVDKFILLAILATLTSAGSAPVPSASLVLLATIVGALGMEFREADFGLILMIDWFLDRMRTMVNVIGDATVAGIVNSRFGVELPELEMGGETIQNFQELQRTKSQDKSAYTTPLAHS